MPLWTLEKIYENVRSNHNYNVIPDRLKILTPKLLNEAKDKYTRVALAKLIADQDPDNLIVGSTGKDSRIQPTNKDFDRDSFEELINSTPDILNSTEDDPKTLKVDRILFPGEEGSTSGSLKTFLVVDSEGNEYPVVLGKGVGFATIKEDFSRIAIEDKLKELLKESDNDYITLRVNDMEYEINGIENVSGFPKADAVFTKDGEDRVYISLKSGKGPDNLNQWGGVSKVTGLNTHPEVVEFVRNLKKLLNAKNGEVMMIPKDSFMQHIEDDDLKLKAMYGKNNEGADIPYSQREFGINNVHLIAQDSPNDYDFKEVNKSKNIYELTANKIFYNGDLPGSGSDEGYSPVFFARYTEGAFYAGIKNCRIGIIPYKKMVKVRKTIDAAGKIVKKVDTKDRNVADLLKQMEG